MELSSPRFKAIAVSLGFTFWFFILTSAFNVFTLEIFSIFVVTIFAITQVLSVKLAKWLDKFAIVNTKIFLGILFVFVISIYGIFFRVLRIDILRLAKRDDTYWLELEDLKRARIFKQY